MIKIPERLKNKLDKSDEWISNVSKVIMNTKHLYITTPYFFEEYTNHGITHINNILDIANKLIPDISLKSMSEKELGIYIISLLLHDVGMFVSYDGFIQLLSEQKGSIDLAGTRTLNDAWEEYLLKLRHFSEKQLMDKFGTVDIQNVVLKDKINLDTKSKLVIGEFLRHHHHNIAHYIVSNGLEGKDFLEGTSVDSETRDLIGLIVRSHGMDIRDTEMYLRSKFNYIGKPKNISVFYIMVLLRIADYLDVGEERAPHIIRSFYVKHSDVSKREYAWNQCMKHGDFVWENSKECISVDATPSNPDQFIDIKKWIKGVQYELDICWAVIGEHYDPNKYKMSIRRLDSNILKKEVVDEYEKKFHTEEAYLDANADILKLLIAPLYGDDPSYGVREILQNAVDACRERQKKEHVKRKKYEGIVKVILDTQNKNILFIDNGIGMKIDVIKKYYLVAGASYRRSDAWNREFAESHGNSKVLRNGKFGIGVLATFLLGERAKITTRSMDEEEGWEFTIELDQNNIEIRRVSTEIGTKIWIDLTDDIIEELKNQNKWNCCKWYEWYIGDFPEVSYWVNDEQKEVYRDDRKIKQYELIQNEYSKYTWWYDRSYVYGRKQIACNGIVIPGYSCFNHQKEYRFDVALPNLRIQDAEGKLPINLARSELLSVPCKKELYVECCKYVLAKFLMLDLGDKINKSRFSYKSNWYNEGKYIIYTSNGYTLCDSAFMSVAGIESVNIVCVKRMGQEINVQNIDSDKPVLIHELTQSRVTKSLFEESISEHFFGQNIEESLRILHIHKNEYSYVQDRIQKPKWKYLKVYEKDDRYTISKSDFIEKETIRFDVELFPMVVETDIRVDNLCETDIMLQVLKKYLKPNCYIPYDLEERKRMFPKAFRELKKYME